VPSSDGNDVIMKMKRKILIAQENRKIEESLTTLLKDAYDLIDADDGFEAWEIFKSSDIHIDLIIMGLQLQRLSGPELLKKIREVNCWLPVIIVTGSGTPESAEQAGRLGAPSYITIPFDSNLLLREISMLLNIFDPDVSLEKSLIHDADIDGQKPHPVTEFVLREMRTKFNKRLTLQNITDQLGMTEEHLCRIFRKDCHLTPHGYLIKLRINAATSLLENTQYSIETIAELTGFHDHSHFTRTFKHVTGVSPGKFRYQARKEREKEK
jgi:YesN/AraC family two-component response regulator